MREGRWNRWVMAVTGSSEVLHNQAEREHKTGYMMVADTGTNYLAGGRSALKGGRSMMSPPVYRYTRQGVYIEVSILTL